MKLSAPRMVTFGISAALAVIALLAHLGGTGYAFWLLAIAYLVLALANLAKNL